MSSDGSSAAQHPFFFPSYWAWVAAAVASLLSPLSSAQKTVVGCGQRQQVPHKVDEEALLGEDDREDPIPDPAEAWTMTADVEYRF